MEWWNMWLVSSHLSHPSLVDPLTKAWGLALSWAIRKTKNEFALNDNKAYPKKAMKLAESMMGFLNCWRRLLS